MTETTNAYAGQSAEGVLALAQKIYDEHVSEGENIRARLISEAEAEAHRIMSEAETVAGRLLEESERVHAEKTAAAEIEAENLLKESASQLESQKVQLAFLQNFEAEYRKDLQDLVDRAALILHIEKEDETEPTPAEENIEEVSPENNDENFDTGEVALDNESLGEETETDESDESSSEGLNNDEKQWNVVEDEETFAPKIYDLGSDK